MSCVVQKFGGTSVATLERINHVAEIVAKNKQNKNIVAVVSAMAGVTNKFIEYAHSLNGYEGNPEYDFIISSGEMVTAGLLSVALNNMGIKARSYAGWQVPINTSSNYGSADIESIGIQNIISDLNNGIVPIICGFQGIDKKNRITTLGRGGSDLTAVAIADAIKAEICDIYSDVDGVYTVDPNLYFKAKRLDKVYYNEMLEMAALGAKVLQEQSVAYALKKQIKIRVASSFVENGGTIISNEIPTRKFCGIAITHNLVQLKVFYNNESLDIDSLLRKHFIRIDIIKVVPYKISFFLDRKKLNIVKEILLKIDNVINIKQEMIHRHCSRLSLIGFDLKQKDFEYVLSLMSSNNIEIFCCSKGKYGINLVLLTEFLFKAIDILHRNCGL